MRVCIRTKLVIICGVLLGLLILASCGQQKAGGPPGPPEVVVLAVTPEKISTTTELSGRTSAYRASEIRPQVNGIIQKRLFVEGSDVKVGQVLYQIDPAPFQAALDNAKAALEKAEANLPAIRSRVERFRELLADKAVSQQDYDDANAALKQSQADVQYCKATVETARINLGYTRITAPISGRIGKSNVTEGALVTAHQPVALATIQQLDPIYVDIPQSTTDLLRLQQRMADGRLNRDGKNGNKVKLILEDGTPYPLEGTLQFRDVTVDPSTGSVILRVVAPNPKEHLLPGMFIRTVVQEGINSQAMLIPQQAVSRDPRGNPLTLIVDTENKVQVRPLVLDRAIGDRWLVASGLTPGDRVIIEGVQKVRPGAPVKIVPAGAGSENKGGEPGKTVPDSTAKSN
ncbi:MAG TPA: efflux RND transporter periplasmic adaptor subunit [Syntrophales bacterium]|nr:efflux RND transporter periplasmic adaptor subunit [Syntrophales bacterium]